MQTLQTYFSHVPDSHRVALLTACLFFFWNLENKLGFTTQNKKWTHALINAWFLIPGALVNLLMGYTLTKTVSMTEAHQWGLLPMLHFKRAIIVFLISFTLLDFCEYVYHVVMHKVKTLWMFHVVHHSDRQMDVSTVLREHPGETFIRLSFLVLWMLLLGVPFWALLLRQFIQITSNTLAHAHFRLPERMDRVIGLVFITPNLHHVHHHYQQPFTDSNYGDVLSIWDQLFGTFRRMKSHEVVFGIDTFMDARENAVFQKLLTMPFNGYRPPLALTQTAPSPQSESRDDLYEDASPIVTG